MINAIIIDDEKDARATLRLLINRYCPEVNILSLCPTPEEGIETINHLQPDLVFLDVQMPRMSGFDVLDQLESINFDTIFVTAYDKYAIRAIKFSALDYLLKPVDVDDLIAAIGKTKKHRHQKHRYQSLIQNIRQGDDKLKRLAIPAENEIIIQKIDEIVYCEANSNYTIIHNAEGSKVTVAKTLKEFENILPTADFCRIHHGTLVNLTHIVKYVRGEGGYVIVSQGDHLDVSRRKKDNLLHALNKL